MLSSSKVRLDAIRMPRRRERDQLVLDALAAQNRDSAPIPPPAAPSDDVCKTRAAGARKSAIADISPKSFAGRNVTFTVRSDAERSSPPEQ
jgi:hypothetical protein